ncbi:MFS transporter [Streptomyces nanshensis]|uniref:MFS transporter permease n=1 Tax=Streptomyces nanshensis TaxID=518642 RepID=A0A1E7LA47_9ACTN|nr:MFS transporter [Streptomyces nanshensis]OEV12863.1 MFS transporter permease [Streptomyces nanshensis]
MPVSQAARTWLPAASALYVAGWGASQFAPLAVVYRVQEGWAALAVATMFTLYLVGLVPGLLLGGRIADRYGRRRVVRGALAVSSAASALLAAAAVSEDAVYPSRLATGFAAGIVLSAGATWLEEISEAGGQDAGNRRALYATGAGFASGALAAGCVAEWLPQPMVLPCLLHSLLVLLVCCATRRAPETAASREDGTAPPRPPRMRWTIVTHPRFVLVVLPASPAAFAAATVAYVVLPPLVIDQVHGHAPMFSGLVVGVTIAVGVAVQPLATWLDQAGSARSTLVAMATVVVGLLAGAVAVSLDSPLLVLPAAVVLGAGYGLTLASGLKEIERLAHGPALPTASSVYQGATHSGFLAPLLLAMSAGAAPYPALLVGLAAVGVLLLGITAYYSRRHLPAVAGGAPGR